MKMNRSVLAVCVILIPGVAGALQCRAEDQERSSIREVLLSSKSVYENCTYAPPISWRFDRKGSFGASALTGRASWSAKGTWKETPEGHISLDGVTDHAFDVRQKGLVFKKIIVGVEVIERKENMIWVRFRYSEAREKEAENNGQSPPCS